MFDSASGMLRALAQALEQRGFAALGQSRGAALFARHANVLPTRLRDLVFASGGPREGIWPKDSAQVDAEAIAAWMVERYPRQQYPAAMIGSSNGALVHLAAAFGTPWLPQTWLTLVRQGHADPDDGFAAMEAGIDIGERLLAANPEVTVHHMHDPNQDRRMVRLVSYFRLKHRTLPAAYRRFLVQSLSPGATLYVVNCRQRWPLTRLSERHYFQFGAVGGASPDAYFEGDPAVERYFERLGIPRRRWAAPAPDTEGAEAEWGYEAGLDADLLRLAAHRRLRVVRISFDEPEDVSPLVADIWRDWYREHGIPSRRLLIPSFILMDPHWTVRTASVPFWMLFNVAASQPRIRRYLAQAGPFEEIRMMLFPNGTEALGQGSIESWRTILAEASREGSFLGVDEKAYPHDLEAFVRYHTSLKSLDGQITPPPPLEFGRAEEMMRRLGERYGVRVEEVQASEAAP